MTPTEYATEFAARATDVDAALRFEIETLNRMIEEINTQESVAVDAMDRTLCAARRFTLHNVLLTMNERRKAYAAFRAAEQK